MKSTDGRLSGRWSDDRGRCVVEAHDGTTRDGLALGMDDHGRVVVAVKTGATVRQLTVDAGAVIMDSERDAQALRAARLQRSANLSRQATTDARSALAGAIANAQALASQDQRRAQATAQAMAGDRS